MRDSVLSRAVFAEIEIVAPAKLRLERTELQIDRRSPRFPSPSIGAVLRKDERSATLRGSRERARLAQAAASCQVRWLAQ